MNISTEMGPPRAFRHDQVQTDRKRGRHTDSLTNHSRYQNNGLGGVTFGHFDGDWSSERIADVDDFVEAANSSFSSGIM